MIETKYGEVGALYVTAIKDSRTTRSYHEQAVTVNGYQFY